MTAPILYSFRRCPYAMRARLAVVDESLDVMHWALEQADPEDWLSADPDTTADLIARNDGPFKNALDRYKYPPRYVDENVDPVEQRALGLTILEDLNQRIADNGGHLLRPTRSLADIAIFPFVRQFAHTDREWFATQPLPALQDWLKRHLDSPLFKGVMVKHPLWEPGAVEPKLVSA